MTKEEILDRIEELNDLIDGETDPIRKKTFESLRDDYISQLSEIERSTNDRTVGQRVGAGVGRLGGIVVGMVAGEIETCVTGKDIKRTRGKIADQGENIGSAIGGVLERLINTGRRRK